MIWWRLLLLRLCMCGGCWRGKEGKTFFSEEKKQKTFAPCRRLSNW